MTRHLEVSRDIAASPQAVYDAISDISRMGEWSPECHQCEWLDDATSAVVGARFDGHNRNEGNEWTTQGTVSAADPGRKFAFDCSVRDFHYATWSYEIEEIETGSRVTEIWDDYRPEEIINQPSRSGVADRVAFNQESMATTLDRLAAGVEG